MISFRTRRPIRDVALARRRIPRHGRGVGKRPGALLTGCYDGVLYEISTGTGRPMRRIRVGAGPHGAAVWPQPGRYSLEHTGILR